MAEDRSSEELAKLQKKLYRRDAEFTDQRPELKPLNIDPKVMGWHQASNLETNMTPAQPKKRSIVYLVFVVSLVFFIGAIVLAGFQYLTGLNLVSSGNIDLALSGTEKVNAGEEVQLSLVIANRNQKSLEAARIIVAFPAGSRDALDQTKPVRELREDVGTINSGQSITKVFKAVLYGQEKDEKEITAILEYRIAGSNATLTKTESFKVTIGSSPVRVTASAPDEVNSGQPFSLKIDVVANAQNKVNDLALVVDYPPGFTFVKASPAPDNGGKVWRFSQLNPGQTKTIVIDGNIQAQDNENKSFQIGVGTLADPSDLGLAVEYNSLFELIAIKRPFVDLKVAVNNNSGNSVIDSSKVVPVEISWVNALPVEIRNAKIEVAIDGELFEPKNVSALFGHFDSQTNTISWNQNDAALGVILPGQTGKVSFEFGTKSLLEGSGVNLYRPTVELSAKFTGIRESGNNASEQIQVINDVNLKVNTVVQLLSRALYHTGQFSPTGPMPPRVGQETLYTIEWTLLNSTNDVSEAKVSAVLPRGLRFAGSVAPQNENVSYDDVSRIITWNIGSLRPLSQLPDGRREVAFRIGLTPSANQVGEIPQLLNTTAFTGIDTFTQKVLNIGVPDLDIRLTKDPLFKLSTEARIVP